MAAKTLLIVEDEYAIRELLRAQLSAAGYETIAARTGSEAVARVRNFIVDGVILDLNLPEIDGFEVLKAIREMPSISRLPVLILSARHAEEDVRRAIVLGARDYLAKPFTEEQLKGRVARLLRPRFEPGPQASRH